MPDSVAHARFQRYGPRKVGQLLRLIRGKSLEQADGILSFAPRRAALLVAKTLRSAAANLGVKMGRPVEPNHVWVRQAWVGQGPTKALRRIQPGPMGRAMPFKRKMCHVTIRVGSERSQV